jgi:YidC/Oxa1 family membrane protein insertase
LLPVQNQFFWLNLAQPDPLFVLPVLVFATTFLQQKLLTPQAKPDDKKKNGENENPMAGMTQSMQYTMPLMFGFFALQFPAGLSLYFILSNVIGVGQGLLVRRSAEEDKAANAKTGRAAKTELPKPAASETNKNGSSSETTSRQQRAKKRRRRKRS